MRSLLHSLCAVALGASLCVAEAQSLAAFEEWVRETAVPFDTLDEPMSPALRTTWRELRGERPLVFLGEPDHSILEGYAARLWLLPLLYEDGFRHVVAEIGVESGHRIDAALAGVSGGADMTSVTARTCMTALLGDEGAERWSLFPGIVGRERGDAAFRSALISMGGADRWYFHGVDVDIPSACAYLRLLDEIDAHVEGAADLQRVREEIFPRAVETPVEERARLAFAFTLFDAISRRLERSIGAESVGELRDAIAQLDASVAFVHNSSRSSQHLRLRASEQREELLVLNTERLLAEGGDDMRAVFIGHNAHFAFDSSNIAYGPIGPSGTLMWKMLGDALHETRGEDILGVWLMAASGTRVDVSGVVSFEMPPDAIESVFARVGGPFVLALDSDDPRASWLDEVRHFGVSGKLAHGRLRELTDVVIFVPEVRAINDVNAAALER